MGYMVAEMIRLLIGAGLAWAAAATGQVAGPLGALGVGVAAPTIIGQLVKAIPLSAVPDSRQNSAVTSVVPSGIPHARGSSIPVMEPGTGANIGE